MRLLNQNYSHNWDKFDNYEIKNKRWKQLINYDKN